MENKTYRVSRTIIRSQYQIVEAKDEDEATEIAVDSNPENFEDYSNSDDDWQYTVEEITTVTVPLEM